METIYDVNTAEVTSEASAASTGCENIINYPLNMLKDHLICDNHLLHSTTHRNMKETQSSNYLNILCNI